MAGGVLADLQLDTRQALTAVGAVESAITTATTATLLLDTSGVTGQITSAVDAADTSVTVVAEADQVTGEVTGAVDAADTDVIISGTADDLTARITSAVDAADTDVAVTGDASQITGAVTGAVDAADTDVVLTADSSSVAAATSSVGGLDDALGAATGSAVGLGGALAAIGAGAAVAGLSALVLAASDLEQAIGGTEAVFGESEGVIRSFAEGADEAAGLTEEAARRLTSQLGGLLQGFGFAQDEAAATSVALAQLGADLAATFGGAPEEAVQALGAALRGEFDPLERFGVSLNITQANLRAVELGLADSTSNVDLNARAQAALSLIMERSAQAQGQFGRELDTVGGQLAVLRAEAGNAAAGVGATLTPAVIDLIAQVRSDLLPSLVDLASALGPSLVSVISSLLPALGTVSSLLVAAEPLVRGFALALSAIPEPVLSTLGTIIAFRAAAGPLGNVLQALGFSLLRNLAVPAGTVAGAFNTASTATQSFGSRARSALSSVSAGGVALAAVSVAFVGYSQAQAAAAEEARRLEAQQQGLQESLRSSEGTVEGLRSKLDELVDTGAKFEGGGFLSDVLADGRSFQQIFDDAGTTVDSFVGAIERGTPATQGYVEAIRQSSAEGARLAPVLQDLANQTIAQSEAAIEAGLATDEYTQAQVDSAIEQTRAADGSRNYVAALALLQEAQNEAEAAEQAQTQALTDQQQALSDLAVTAPQLTFALGGLTQEATRNADVLTAFALAADAAGLSGTDLDAVVAQLGSTSGPALQAAISAVAETITGIRDAGLGTLPTLQDIAGAVDDFTLSGFRDELADSLTAITDFNTNLGLIAEQGGPRLAAAAAQLGPTFAAEIARGIRDGEDDVIAQAELLLQGIENAGTDTESLLTGTIGPNLATATGQMGVLATTAFGNNFTLDASGKIVQLEETIIGGRPGVQTRMAELGSLGALGFETSFTPDAGPGVAGARDTIAGSGPGVANRAAEVGSAGKGGFEGGFKPDPRPALGQAQALVRSGVPLMNKAGQAVGRATVDGFATAVRPMRGVGSAAAAAAISGVSGLSLVARIAGFGVGSALGAGINAGIASWTESISATAASAVAAAATAARTEAQAASPSQLFADIGEDIGAGLVLGIERATADAAAATADLVAGAAASVLTAGAAPALAPVVTAAAAAGSGGGGGGDGTTVVFQPGSVVIQAPTEAAARRGATIVLDTIRKGARGAAFVAHTGGRG